MIQKGQTVKVGSMEVKILDIKPVSNHPADKHLMHVLAEIPSKGEFATWFYNAEFNGYYHGRYFNSLEIAEIDFRNRG